MTNPLWVDPSEQRFPRLETSLQVDLAVVGGGFSGLGAAWAATQRGARVAILEARTIASGASGRNAGFVLAGPALGFRAAETAIGRDGVLDIWQVTRENHATLVSLIDDFGLECGYVRRGSISLAASESEWDGMTADSRELQTAGIHVCDVPRCDLPRPFDEMYVGGLYFAGNGELNPGAFLRGVADRLSGDVAEYEDSRVLRIHTDGPVTLDCAKGSVRASRVVIATNAYTSTLLPCIPVVPTRGQVASTVPIHQVLVPFPMYADRGFQYWRQTAEGRFVVGGWRNVAMNEEIGTEETLHAAIQERLDTFAARVAPGARVDRRWAGIMGFTRDHFPLVGSVPGHPDLFLAAGYSGHGVALAFQCGALAARLSLGEPVHIPAAFNPARLLSPV